MSNENTNVRNNWNQVSRLTTLYSLVLYYNALYCAIILDYRVVLVMFYLATTVLFQVD